MPRRSHSHSSSDDDDSDAPPAELTSHGRRRPVAAHDEDDTDSDAPSMSGDESELSEGGDAPHASPPTGRREADLPLGLRARTAAAPSTSGRRHHNTHAGAEEGSEDDDDPHDLRRANKNRPAVLPAHGSHRRRAQPADIVGLPTNLLRPASRDPRFDDLAAEKRVRPGRAARRAVAAVAGGGAAGAAAAGDARARARYAFLFEERLPAEKAELAASLRKAKAPAARAALQARLTQVSQALAADSAARTANSVLADRRAAERAAVAAGKRPYYQKPAVARREALVAKFKALKESGKLEAAMAKRRKKNAAKAHRHMPFRRVEE